MKIRKAKISDIEQIVQVHIACWKTTYKGIVPDEFLENLSADKSIKNWKNFYSNSPNNILLVAENENSQIIGFCSGGLNRDKEKTARFHGELMAIYILEDYQKQGIGKKLVKALVQALREKNINNMVAWVLEENNSKIFYEKIGCEFVAKKTLEIGGKELTVIAYGIDNLDDLRI